MPLTLDTLILVSLGLIGLDCLLIKAILAWLIITRPRPGR